MDKKSNITEHVIPVLIGLSAFLVPYGVQAYTNAFFAHGLIWYFPFWRFYHGYDEAGLFAFVRTLGMRRFPLIELEPLVIVMILATAIILADIMRLVGNDTDQYHLGLVSVIAVLIIEISMPVLATATIESEWRIWMVTGVIPVPIPAIIAAMGLIHIHRIRENSHSPRYKQEL